MRNIIPRKVCCFALLFLLLLTVACERKPKNLIDEHRMAALLTDVYRLEGFYAVERSMDSLITDSVIVATYDSVFCSHGVTRQQFDESIAYYMRHTDKYKEIHKRVTGNIDKEINQ